MFSAKSQRRAAWAPRATAHSNGQNKNGDNFGERRTLPVNTSFRGTYHWGPPSKTNAKNSNGNKSNGCDTSPTVDGDNAPTEAYCTVEEIQLGKRHSKSPIMGNGVGMARVQWRNEHPQQQQLGEKSEQGEDALEENYYEDGDASGDGDNGKSNGRNGGSAGGKVRDKSAPKVGTSGDKQQQVVVQPLPPKVPPLPPPLPPPKLFGKGRHELKPFRQSNLARFWPALAFLAFCLILLSIAFLSLWVVNNSNNSDKRHKSQMNWPLRLVPMPTSTAVSPNSTAKVRSVLPPVTLPAGIETEGEEKEEREEGEEEDKALDKASMAMDKASTAFRSSATSQEGATAADGQQRAQQDGMDVQQVQNWSASLSQMTSLSSAAAVDADQFVVQPEQFVRWLADGRMRKRLRLFEVRERNSHPATAVALPPAKVLLLSSLSHNGVPVHPLQFQRFLRSEDVDNGSVVLLYDVQSSQQLLAHYALWLFRLFGLDHSLLLTDGPNWTVNGTPLAKLIEADGLTLPNVHPGHLPVGTFRAQWRAEFISTFDDVLANFERESANPKADIVDAQTEKEFNGHAAVSVPGPSSQSVPGAIFGHIRGAQSVSVESLAGLSPEGQSTLFTAQFGLSRARAVIVYDGFSSHRAAFVWTALRRANFSAELYFGAWPEWLVRAPDDLKVIPDN